MKNGHQCKPAAPYCHCYLLADEPSEDCPIHGGAINNRCECGRFVRVRQALREAERQPLTNDAGSLNAEARAED